MCRSLDSAGGVGYVGGDGRQGLDEGFGPACGGAGVKPPPPGGDSGLVATVTAQLREAGQMHTIAGQSALQVAEHLCRGGISGSERAALMKALNEALGRALTAADTADVPLTLLRRQVAAKRAEWSR